MRKFRTITSRVPNTLTLLNLLCGSAATFLALQEQMEVAAWLILAGYLFDLFDGMAARLLNVQSAVGKELDSLADLISFGLAPAAILYGMHGELTGAGPIDLSGPPSEWLIRMIPLLLPVFAGLRLARFNVDDRQTDQFIGLPTPANGLMVLSLPLIMHYQPASFLIRWLESGWLIPLYSVVISLLMVSPIRLFSLKIKGFAWHEGRFTYILIFLSAPLLVLFGLTGLFLAVPLYFAYTAILSLVAPPAAH